MASSLYVHIPFCLKRCLYCDFVSGVYSPDREKPYGEALKREVKSIPADVPLKTLYIGGGTPTSLSTAALSEILTCIFQHFSFDDAYEATIEANPGTVKGEKLRVIRSSGINRISIGIQSFQDEDLRCLGRIHSSQDAGRAVSLARSAGFENIGLDLIYAIPGQKIRAWKDSLQKALRLGPHHISVYELSVEKGTELRSAVRSGKQKMPHEEEVIAMYEYARDYLLCEGYLQYEISNFALAGYQCRHNLNYWNRGEYYGAGLGAHSHIGGRRCMNPDDLHEYIKGDAGAGNPLLEAEYKEERGALSEALFLGLRKTEGIEIEALHKQYGHDVLQRFKREIDDLQEAGLIEVKPSDMASRRGPFLRLTRRGMILSNEVFLKFLS